MVIVTSGKLVMGLDVFSTGDVIEGLSAAAEKKLIAMGLVARSNGVADAAPDVNGQKEPSKAELQERCRELGLSDRGNKAELKARIDEFESAAVEEPETDEAGDEDEPPALSAEVPQ